MDKRFLGIAGSIIGVAVLAGIIILATRSPQKTIEETTPLPPSNNTVQNPTRTSQDRTGEIIEQAAVVETPEVEAVQPVELTDRNAQDLTLYEEDLLDDDVVARLLEEFGSYAAIYEAVTPAQREELIDWLSGEEQLREYVGDLLPLERDSDLRAYMVRRVEPKGFWDGDENADDEDYVDSDLIAILDRPTDTPINAEEWMARTDLANLIDYDYTLQWTREARLAHPDDLSVNLQSASLTMTINSSIEGVSAGEVAAAEDYIRDSFTGPRAGEMTSDERVRGYFSLYWSEDRENTRDFYRERLEDEDDPRARQTLESLLDRLDRRLAGTQ